MITNDELEARKRMIGARWPMRVRVATAAAIAVLLASDIALIATEPDISQSTTPSEQNTQ